MKAKVNCSALYPYFDLLAGDEVNLKGFTNIPIYVRQQLKNIYELFEDISELTLEEVKALYFERKMYKKDSKGKIATKTKKVKELCIGDKVFFFFPYEGYEGEEIITKLQEFSPTQIRIITERGTEAIFQKDKVISLTE